MNSQTISTTISIANQTAVPSLIRRQLGLKPGDHLLWEIDPPNAAVKVKPAPRLWGKYMRGLGKNVWAGTDTAKYIKSLRKERKL